jgi:hypothetical protein
MDTYRRQHLGTGLKGMGIILLLVAVTGARAPVLADTPAYTPEGFDAFTGAGFDPNPAAGQLDSDTWAVYGASDGDVAFGGSCSSGDCARGIDDNGTSTGGVYAFDVISDTAAADYILGVQPIEADFTPGAIYLRLQNTTGSTINDVWVQYEAWYNNNENRASSFSFGIAKCGDGDCENASYTLVASHSFTTTLAEDTNGWTLHGGAAKTHTVSGLDVGNNEYICLRWTTDDAGGSGSRDELGIDDVEVRASDSNAVTLSALTAQDAHNLAALPIISGLGVLMLASGVVISHRRQGIPTR